MKLGTWAEALALSFTLCSDPTDMIDNLSATLSQIRGEIMHEFSRIEYYVRSALAHFLSQPCKNCKTYREQLRRFSKFIAAQRRIEWKSKILRNPDVYLLSAELSAAESAFGNCLDRLVQAAAKANYSKMSKLLP